MTAPAVRLDRQFADSIRRICLVPDNLTVSQFADTYRILPETSTAPGPYSSAVTPYARRPMDLAGDPETWKIVLCWGSQTTKSTVVENIIMHRIIRRPGPMLFVQPTIEHAEGVAKERLVPMILATPLLRDRVRLGKATDSTLRFKRFAGGFLFLPAARSGTELASRPAPDLFCDEIDLYEDLAKEGNPLEIVRKRQGAADIGLELLTSSPRDAETTRIWPELEGGTYEKWQMPCTHCHQYQVLRWGGPADPFGLKWPAGKPMQAQYLCEHCNCLIDEHEKPGMLAAARWEITNPSAPAGYYSFHLTSLNSPFAKSSWGVLAREFESGHAKPADLQVFVNTRLAELWVEKDSHKLDATDLQARLEPGEEAPREDGMWGVTDGVIPEGVGAITAGTDVQQNRLEIRIWGWGAGLESWLLQKIILPGDPSRPPSTAGSVWRDWYAVMLRPLRHVHGRLLRINAGLIDSGHATTQVYRAAKRLRSRKIFASKGVDLHPILGKPTPQTNERFIQFTHGTNQGKNEFLRSQLHERAHGPGYVHLPAWLEQDPEELEQLTAEKRVPKVVRGRVYHTWVKKHEDDPNEGLDCRLLARAALELLGAQRIKNLGKWAERWAQPVESTSETTAPEKKAAVTDEDDILPPPPPPRSTPRARPRGKSSWVQGWK